MADTIRIGECIRCKEKRKVNVIKCNDGNNEYDILMCDRCSSNEDREIRQMIERREKNDNGERFSQKDAIKILQDRLEKGDK